MRKAMLPKTGDYILVVEGFDWGPAASKVILHSDNSLGDLEPGQFRVQVERADATDGLIEGTLEVTDAFSSNELGEKDLGGRYTTLVFRVGPEQRLTSPMHWTTDGPFPCNSWLDYKLLIADKKSGLTWNREVDRIHPLVDQFDLGGLHTNEEGHEMVFASYQPAARADRVPLIIWLHGGGEGGVDPTIPLLANRAANYASDEIQAIFGGAHVLVPQSPTYWMQAPGNGSTWGEVDDIYYEWLKQLIDDYVHANPEIDENRIYLGGCSNGGYMTLKLILENPDYFAAGFIVCLAYRSEHLTNKQIESIAHVPMWFVHSKDDRVTSPDVTAVPVYSRLIEAGAPDVHFSYYDHVIDITGKYGGDDYRYNGHFSWIYCHANECRLDFDGSPVTVDGKEVTIMEWLSAQRKD